MSRPGCGRRARNGGHRRNGDTSRAFVPRSTSIYVFQTSQRRAAHKFVQERAGGAENGIADSDVVAGDDDV